MAPSPPPPLPLPLPLLDDLIEEILLRLPPDEPAYLVHAALVCKTWRCILSDAGFRRRYCELHRSPPLLGYIQNIWHGIGLTSRLVPTCTASPPFSSPATKASAISWALDCRHGRVLILRYYPMELVVWDPITGEQQCLHRPEFPNDYNTAAVLCAVDGCDHLACHGGPFRVVFVGTNIVDGSDVPNVAWAAVYSSETGVWSNRTTVVSIGNQYYMQDRPSLLIGDDLYFTLRNCVRTIKYNLNAHALSVIDSPCVFRAIANKAEDGGLGFIAVLDGSICVWSLLRASAESDEGWFKAQQWVMDIGTLLPSDPCRSCEVVGLMEGTDTVFINSNVGLFTLNLKSRQVRKVGRGGEHYSDIVPYRSFYIPDFAKGKLPLP